MNCGYCRDCNLWQVYKRDPGMGNCSRIHAEDTKAEPDPSSYTFRGKGAPVNLCTESDFGCVQFEPKPSPLPAARHSV